MIEKLLKSKKLKEIEEIFSQEDLNKMKITKFKRGDVIKIPYNNVYLLIDGALNLIYYTENGKKFILSTVLPEDFFFWFFCIFKPRRFTKLLYHRSGKYRALFKN